MKPLAPVTRIFAINSCRDKYAGSNHAHFRHRNDEAAAASSVLGLLLQNFVGEVPRQKQDIVRAIFEQFRWRMNWQAHPGHVTSLLVSATVYDEIQRLAADMKVIQKRAAFGRGAVGGKAVLLTLQIRYQSAKVILHVFNASRKLSIESNRADSPRLLFRQQCSE